MTRGAVAGAQSAGQGQAQNSADLKYFADELARARRQVARLEEEYRQAAAAARAAQRLAPAPVEESPALAKACNVAIWMVVALPFVVALFVLMKRLIG